MPAAGGTAVASPDGPAHRRAAVVSVATGARNRNPRFGSVCTNRGLSPLSPSAVRTWADAVGQAAVVVHVRVPAPDRRPQLVAGDDLAGPREQHRQRPRRLRLEPDGSALARQLEGAAIEAEGAEEVVIAGARG